MPLSDTTKLNIAFKRLQGKAQTDNAKEAFNEAQASGPTIYAASVPAFEIPSTPSNNALYDITLTPDLYPVVEYLRCPLVLDPSSNGHAYFAALPSSYETFSTNPKKGIAPFLNSQQMVLSYGKLQAVPPTYGLSYEVKLYTGGTEGAKGSGTLIPAGDPRDWLFDYFSGVVFQEDTGATPSFIELFVYVGSMVSEGLVVVPTIPKINDNAGSLNYGQVVYLKTNGNVDLARADIANLHKYGIGLVYTGASSGATAKVVVEPGVILTGFSGLTPGYFQVIDPYTYGAMTEIDPGFSSGNFVYRVAENLTTTSIMFCPDPEIYV